MATYDKSIDQSWMINERAPVRLNDVNGGHEAQRALKKLPFLCLTL